MNPGFLELKTAQQLFAKLEEDFKMAIATPLDSRLWLNFFVTAEHLPEWHFTTNPTPPEFRKQHAILRVCSHIANGGKHFDVSTSGRHRAIASTAVTLQVSYGPDGRSLQTKDNASQEDRAFILHLSQEEASELGAEILVVELAKQILALYRNTLAIKAAKPDNVPESE
jgi:hypothetical protein